MLFSGSKHQKRKGFAITPVVFAGLFLVVGIMLLNFLVLDFKVSEGITQESRLSKLLSEGLVNKTSSENLLLFHSLDAIPLSQNTSQLESTLTQKMGGPVHVTVCNQDSLNLSYTGTFYRNESGMTVNKTYTIQRTVTCGMLEKITGQNASVECATTDFVCS